MSPNRYSSTAQWQAAHPELALLRRAESGDASSVQDWASQRGRDIQDWIASRSPIAVYIACSIFGFLVLLIVVYLVWLAVRRCRNKAAAEAQGWRPVNAPLPEMRATGGLSSSSSFFNDSRFYAPDEGRLQETYSRASSDLYDPAPPSRAPSYPGPHSSTPSALERQRMSNTSSTPSALTPSLSLSSTTISDSSTRTATSAHPASLQPTVLSPSTRSSTAAGNLGLVHTLPPPPSSGKGGAGAGSSALSTVSGMSHVVPALHPAEMDQRDLRRFLLQTPGVQAQQTTSDSTVAVASSPAPKTGGGGGGGGEESSSGHARGTRPQASTSTTSVPTTQAAPTLAAAASSTTTAPLIAPPRPPVLTVDSISSITSAGSGDEPPRVELSRKGTISFGSLLPESAAVLVEEGDSRKDEKQMDKQDMVGAVG